jgi:hypothetical protein
MGLPGMCGMIGAIAKPAMTTDFGIYPTGVQLRTTGDWSFHSDPASAAFALNATVTLDDASLSGKCVLVDQQGHGTFKALTMNEAFAANGGNITDCEVLMGVRFVDLPTSAGGLGACRVSGSSGYVAGFDSDGAPDSVNALRLTNGAFDALVSGTPQDLTLSVGPRFYLRFRIIGTLIGVKGWANGSPEPAAFAEGADTVYTTGGRVGFASMASRDYRLDWFSVALNGATAPGPKG